MNTFVGSARLHKWTRRLAATTALLGLGGCDTNVRETLVTGLNDVSVNLATVLINTFFTTFVSGDTGGGTVTTVNVVFEELIRLTA